MKTKAICKSLVLLLAALGIAAPAQAARSNEAMDKALSTLGLKAEDIRFPPADLAYFYGTELQPPVFQMLRAEPLRIPLFARTYREVLLKNSAQPYQLTLSALHQMGMGVRRAMEGDPLVELDKKSRQKDALVDAITALPGSRWTPEQRRELRARASALPEELASAAAYLILAEIQAMEWRKKAFSKIPATALKSAFVERTEVLRQEVRLDLKGVGPWTRRLVADVDRQALAIGALDLIWALEKAKTRIEKSPVSTKDFRWSTPLGEIAIGGRGNSTYKAGAKYLLIVDQEGDDTYFGGAGSSWDLPVSLLIDVQGKDRYLAGPEIAEAPVGTQKDRNSPRVVPAFGAGVFGYGLLADWDGDDLYRGYRFVQGRGDFGVGLVWDIRGQDRYDCFAQCQASAEFGAGLVIDQQGADQYTAVQQTQGFGGPLGSGFLLDFGTGSDSYTARHEPVEFPSLVDAKFNISLAQGVACGFRSDVIDGYSLSGGFGVLLDGGGDNRFEADFFAQGFAYWYGVGLLSGGQGRDSYHAGKYALGGAAHFGIGVVHEAGGADTYRVEQELGLGHGHDVGIGYFTDENGDDRYEAPNLALGCASAQGLGFFWDRGGADRYSSAEKSILGCASARVELPSIRFAARTVGIFIDSGPGKNDFKTPVLDGSFGSAKKWISQTDIPDGLDTELKERLMGVGVIEP